jgi:hypothetical protein
MKSHLILSICLLLIAIPLSAEVPGINPAHVLDVLTADWNDDGGMDRAVLVEVEEGADLYTYLSSDSSGMLFNTLAKAVVWNGGMWGNLPSLEQAKNSRSFYLHSRNEAIGRHRWHEKLTISVRDNKFVIAGYTRTSYDTLDPDYNSACDVNLLTGKGIHNGVKF